MTVSSTLDRSRQLGNGVTVEFASNIKIFNETDIVVTILTRSTSAVESTLILNDVGLQGYSVIFDTEAETVSITVNAAPTTSQDIFILRAVPQTQSSDFPLASKFPSEKVEDGLDKLTLVLQDQQGALNKVMTIPDASTANPAVPEPNGNASGFLQVNATGDGFTYATLTSTDFVGSFDKDVFNGTGAQTDFTLSFTPAGANAVNVVVNDVPQEPGVDYTVSAQTLSFAVAPASGTGNIYAVNYTTGGTFVSVSDNSISAPKMQSNSIETSSIVDSAVTTVKINDDAVTLAKLDSGIAGNLISYDASGNPSAVATGTAGQALLSNGAGLPPTMQTLVNSGFKKIETQVIVAGAEVIFTGLTGPATYMVIGNEVSNVVSDQFLFVEYGDSGGFKTANYDYGLKNNVVSGGYSGPGYVGGENSARLYITWDGSSASSEPAAGAEIEFDFTLKNMGVSSQLSTIKGTSSYGRTFDNTEMSYIEYFGRYNPALAETITKFRIAPQSGNFSGTFTLMRLDLA